MKPRTVPPTVNKRPRRCLREAGEGKNPSLMCAMEGGTFIHANDAQLSTEAVRGTGGYFGNRGTLRLLLDGVERQVLPLLRNGQRHQRRDQLCYQY